MHRWTLAFAVLWLVGSCGGSDGPAVQNPSGACGVSHDGGRVGYHGPNGSIWVPDCQSDLQREYWRVFTDDGTTSYVIPRPDGAPELQPACVEPTHELRELADKYQLCAPAMNAAQVDAVNHIALADALDIAHYLHGQLRFVVTGAGLGIQPFPIPSDIIDACALGGGTNSNELEALCVRERDNLKGGGVALTYTGRGALELASRLNQLYGIAD